MKAMETKHEILEEYERANEQSVVIQYWNFHSLQNRMKNFINEELNILKFFFDLSTFVFHLRHVLLLGFDALRMPGQTWRMENIATVWKWNIFLTKCWKISRLSNRKKCMEKNLLFPFFFHYPHLHSHPLLDATKSIPLIKFDWFFKRLWDYGYKKFE